MPTITEIVDGLAAAISTITVQTGRSSGALRVQTDALDVVVPPCAVIGLPSSVDYDMTFMRGADVYHYSVRLLAGRGSERAAQELLSGFLNGSGSTSIKAAVEADETLGGVVDTTRVTGAGGIGLYQYGETEYLGVEFTIDIIA